MKNYGPKRKAYKNFADLGRRQMNTRSRELLKVIEEDVMVRPIDDVEDIVEQRIRNTGMVIQQLTEIFVKQNDISPEEVSINELNARDADFECDDVPISQEEMDAICKREAEESMYEQGFISRRVRNKNCQRRNDITTKSSSVARPVALKMLKL